MLQRRRSRTRWPPALSCRRRACGCCASQGTPSTSGQPSPVNHLHPFSNRPAVPDIHPTVAHVATYYTSPTGSGVPPDRTALKAAQITLHANTRQTDRSRETQAWTGRALNVATYYTSPTESGVPQDRTALKAAQITLHANTRKTDRSPEAQAWDGVCSLCRNLLHRAPQGKGRTDYPLPISLRDTIELCYRTGLAQ